MNYQYIEQLLDRYFDCITTLEEEQILRSFFNQEDVPAHLMQYREIFTYQTESKKEALGSDFDARMLALVNEEKTKRATLIPMGNSRFAPFFRAAAIVAIILTIGSAAENSMNDHSDDSNADATAISPYIKSGDIAPTLRITDVYQAETKPMTDSISTITPIQKSN